MPKMALVMLRAYSQTIWNGEFASDESGWILSMSSSAPKAPSMTEAKKPVPGQTSHATCLAAE